ncbi:MAG: hypothetical protein HYX67_09980 [Candidatus Melainabacteria bacterium]|nr:hypothetical protein [Candidatus Melainabacteria bacterium]
MSTGLLCFAAFLMGKGGAALASPKVLILTENGGGGHITASTGVEAVLKEGGYQTEVYKPLEKLTLDKKFNDYFQEGQWKKLQFLTLLQQPFEVFAPLTNVRVDLVRKVKDFQPDLIISVFPVANRMTWGIAKGRETPMLVLPTDLKAGHFFHGIVNPGKNFKIGLPFDDPALKKALSQNFFKEKNFEITGFPLRPEFGLSREELAKDIAAIRTELNIADGDKIAVIMMGARGAGDTVLEYSKKLLTGARKPEGGRLHIVALCGKNEELLEKVKAIGRNSSKSGAVVHPVGFKDARFMAGLLRLSDVLVSKPGGSTTNEALASEIFTLFHKPEVLFPWEEGNMNYAKDRHAGEMIQPEHFLDQFNKALVAEKPVIPNVPGREFKTNLLRVVSKMISEGWKQGKQPSGSTETEGETELFATGGAN